MNARLAAAVAELVASLEELIEAAARLDERPPELLSVEEAARRLGVGRTSIYGEIATGLLRSVKVGRRRLIPGTAIAEFIAAGDTSRERVRPADSTADAAHWFRLHGSRRCLR